MRSNGKRFWGAGGDRRHPGDSQGQLLGFAQLIHDSAKGAP
ncbi:hypothetical protein ACPA9J_18330 [Pseudomonas aeruginosa]